MRNFVKVEALGRLRATEPRALETVVITPNGSIFVR